MSDVIGARRQSPLRFLHAPGGDGALLPGRNVERGVAESLGREDVTGRRANERLREVASLGGDLS